MIDHSQAQLTALALHRIGNRHREEHNFLSDQLAQLSDEQEALLLAFVLRPFAKCTEVYEFTEGDPSPVKDYATTILNSPDVLMEQSVHILQHLYAQSDHPHIRVGEVFVTHITGIYFEGKLVDAVGIFKAETKSVFFKFNETDGELVLVDDLGVNAQKLDKGCLIMDTGTENSLRVLSVDANNYDADYWKRNFLGLVQANDSHFQTRTHVQMVKEFSKDVLAPGNRTEQIAFVNEAVQFMNDREEWDNDDFGLTVLRNADLQNAFNDYRQQFSERAGVPLEDSFDISMPELQQQKRKYRNQIDLDTKIQIKLPFSPDGTQQHIERGYDEAKGMFFYKVYFLKEEGS
jgi:hypothetical protein